MPNYELLKLERQLCFPLYACAKEMVRKYRPHLDKLGLTYTQYIALMVLWEEQTLSVKQLGEHLYLDSGTLTPLLKKMEAVGLVQRTRDPSDERSVTVQITEKGMALREQAVEIPDKMGACLAATPEELEQLHTLLYKILGGFSE